MRFALADGEVDISVTYLFKPATLDNLQASPLYYLQAVRSHEGSPKIPMEREYKECVLVYADALANGLDPKSFDALVCVPSSRAFLQQPYREAILKAHPKTRDYTESIRRTNAGGATLEQRVRGLDLRLCPTRLGLKLLLLDDVLATKASATAVMAKFREDDPTLSFKLACPLWIQPTMRNPMRDLFRVAERMLKENR